MLFMLNHLIQILASDEKDKDSPSETATTTSVRSKNPDDNRDGENGTVNSLLSIFTIVIISLLNQ
ncbi:hypothetical protein NUSPORA_00871 [Nucleospora cyclopteri]